MVKSPMKNHSGGKENMKHDKLEDKATSSKGRMHQPKGGMNKQHKKATKMSKKEPNLTNSNMEF